MADLAGFYSIYVCGYCFLTIKDMELIFFYWKPPKGVTSLATLQRRLWMRWRRRGSGVLQLLLILLQQLLLSLLLLLSLSCCVIRRSKKLLVWLGLAVGGRGREGAVCSGRISSPAAGAGRRRLREGLVMRFTGRSSQNIAAWEVDTCTSMAIKRERVDRFWQTKAYINPWNTANTDILLDFM